MKKIKITLENLPLLLSPFGWLIFVLGHNIIAGIFFIALACLFMVSIYIEWKRKG